MMNSINALADQILGLGAQLLDETSQANVETVLALWSGREDLFTELKLMVHRGTQKIPQDLLHMLKFQNDALLKAMVGLKAEQGNRLLALAQNGRAAGSYAATGRYH